jgi:hypothetical protein
MIGKICPVLNLKPTHFKDGWASFDSIDIEQLKSLMMLNCELSSETPILKTIFIMAEHPEIMCFGEVSEKGLIKILGLRGFPSDELCVRFIKDITEQVSKKKINNSYIYVEW